MANRDMLEGVSQNFAALKTEGKTDEEIITAKPTADFEGEWADGFIMPDNRVKLVTPIL